jgi:hypothetical protein
MKTQRGPLAWLLLGDALTALIVTLAGFLTHYQGVEGWRWLSTFVPTVAAWLAVAPWLGVYDPATVNQPRFVWRAALAAVLSAPLAATLRGLWLGSVIVPVFVLVLAATGALGFVIWRWVWTVIARRFLAAPG